jgi:exoribonuclease II
MRGQPASHFHGLIERTVSLILVTREKDSFGDSKDRYQVVAIENRGTLVLAALQREGDKKARVSLSSELSLRIRKHRILHKFDHTISANSLLETELKLWSESTLSHPSSWRVDRDFLWQSLENEQIYSLKELCQSYFGAVCDEAILSFLEIFSARQAEFQLIEGGIRRVDAENREKIRERLKREALESAENIAFINWINSPACHNKAPVELHDLLEGLKKYALCGPENVPRRCRYLAAQLEQRSSDDLLDWLCCKGILNVDVNEVPHRFALKQSYSAEALQQHETIEAQLQRQELGQLELFGQREDLAKHWTITIDQPATWDVDDALSVWQEGSETFVAIHIADVSFFVKDSDALDQEARNRGSTVYLRDMTLSMLPDCFVERVSSLNVGLVRPALSLILRFEEGQQLASEAFFKRSLICVDHRLSYVQTRLKSWLEHPFMIALGGFARAHRRQRLEEGAVSSSQSELRVTFEAGEPQLESIKHDSLGHEIVSELMVLYNSHAAQFLERHKTSALFKVQKSPIREADRLTPEQLKGPLARLQQRFPPAKMAVVPGPHRTLGLRCYVQATAPIRRYIDLLAQRQICQLLESHEAAYSEEEMKEFRRRQEKLLARVRRAEGQRLRYWIHRFLEIDPGPHTAYVSRCNAQRETVQAYLPALHLEIPVHSLDWSQSTHPRVGEEIQVIATEFEPRKRWTRIELFEGF